MIMYAYQQMHKLPPTMTDTKHHGTFFPTNFNKDKHLINWNMFFQL